MKFIKFFSIILIFFTVSCSSNYYKIKKNLVMLTDDFEDLELVVASYYLDLLPDNINYVITGVSSDIILQLKKKYRSKKLLDRKYDASINNFYFINIKIKDKSSCNANVSVSFSFGELAYSKKNVSLIRHKGIWKVVDDKIVELG